MVAFVNFTLEEGVGALIEHCIRGQLENFFTHIALATEPLYSLFLGEAGRMRIVPSMNYRLTASDLREGVQRVEGPELSETLRQGIQGCFTALGIEPVYQVTVEDE